MASLQLHPPYLWTAGTILPVICTAAVGARFATRRAQRAPIGLDDWLTVPALILNIGMAGMLLAGVALKALGYPTPISDVPSDQLLTVSLNKEEIVVAKAFLVTNLLSTASLTFIKLSCMLFYSRVFRVGSAFPTTILIYVMNTLIILWGVGFTVALLSSCGTHFSRQWGNYEEMLSCPAKQGMLNQGLITSDFLMDLLIMLFPIPLILKLQMSRKKKIGVIAVFAAGSGALAVSILRLVIVTQELSVTFNLKNAIDPDFMTTAAIYFGYIEPCFALIVICLPSLSGALKLQSVKNILGSFSGLFSTILGSSRSTNWSRKNSGETEESKTRERLDSHRSDRRFMSSSALGNTSHSRLDVDLRSYAMLTR